VVPLSDRTLAQSAADGWHHCPLPAHLDAEEIAWRRREDAQDAELFRLAAYTGLRLGELLALRGRTSTSSPGA
jgi:integrase